MTKKVSGLYILGISAFYHDSAAVLILDGEIVAAAQEERFTRQKSDMSFPVNTIKYCLSEGKIRIEDISKIVFYDKPLLKFERLLETYLNFAPKGLQSFVMSMPVWLKDKLFLKTTIEKKILDIGKIKKKQLPEILFTDHHRAHAASTFFASPFKKSAVLCLDGVGEWATTTCWVGDEEGLKLQWQLDFPHSLGLLYSAFTYFAGFKVNSGEYKLMGLAPYGKPIYQELILEKIIDLKEDGSFRLNMNYFNYTTGLTMTNSSFSSLFSGPPRVPESEITQREMDLASSIQAVTEKIVLKLAKTIRNETKLESLCLAGGVALNCVANGKLLRSGIFKNIWIQPASGDAGGSLGAALSVWHEFYNKPKILSGGNFTDKMKGSYLGPQYKPEMIKSFLNSIKAPYEELDEDQLMNRVATLISKGKIIGWFQGRMEFGPRSLGSRSIIGDPRKASMQSKMNLKIKYRESFRPFAPSVLAEDTQEYFELNESSPYMQYVSKVHDDQLLLNDKKEVTYFGLDRLKEQRSRLPAITHVDNSARVQTVHNSTNPKFYKLLKYFKEITDCSVLVNTSFNVRGEPIVCSPEDAYRCFMQTEIDYLVLENIILKKEKDFSLIKNNYILD